MIKGFERSIEICDCKKKNRQKEEKFDARFVGDSEFMKR